MIQGQTQTADFSYEQGGVARDAAGLPARVTILAQRPSIRSEIAQDLDSAGFRTLDGGDFSALLDGPITLLGDVVVVDCPSVDGAVLAALVRLDMRAAQAGAQLVVSTAIDALDDVFAALDQSDPQILVKPSRAERVVAVGRVLTCVAQGRVREMNEQDRVALLRLSQQVESIAQELDRISALDGSPDTTIRDDADGWHPKAQTDIPAIGGFENSVLSLPDPRLVRAMIARRQARAKFFDAELFADPAWDMLLDLTAAHAEHQRVSITSLCIAAGVPATTALRWIKQLVETGIFERVADSSDKRRAFIALSDKTVTAMARYFAEIETPLAKAA